MNRIICISIICLIISSCLEEPYCSDDREIELELSANIIGHQLKTRASNLSGCEHNGTGACILSYDSQTNELLQVDYFSQYELDHSQINLKIRCRDYVDFFVIGNLPYYDKQTSSWVSMIEALGEDIPITSSDIRQWVYKLDGQDHNERYRRASMEDIAVCGIPYISELIGFDTHRSAFSYEQGHYVASIDFEAERLFCRIDLAVDCSSLTGGVSGLLEQPRIMIRNANTRIQAFTPMMRAFSSEDTADGDFELYAVSADTLYYSLYVPENMQGELLEENTDPRLKTPLSLRETGLSEDEIGAITYIEFCATAKSSEIWESELSYRFYPGANTVGDFSLERNNIYNTSLSFIYDELIQSGLRPDWKMEVSDPHYKGKFCLTADMFNEIELEQGQDVVIRSNRPAKVYLYHNPDNTLGSNNTIFDLQIGPEQYNNSNYRLCDAWWTSNFAWDENMSIIGPQQKSRLDALGIKMQYDPIDCSISFYVDPNKRQLFMAGIGQRIALRISLMPAYEGSNSSIYFNLCLYQDMQIRYNGGAVPNDILSSEFYPGMARELEFIGFSGDIAFKCSDSLCFRYSKTDPGARIRSEYELNQAVSGKLNIYNYFPMSDTHRNDFLKLCSLDSFNDGDQEYIFSIISSHSSIGSGFFNRLNSVFLEPTGTSASIDNLSVYDTMKRKISMSRFDPDVFREVYSPTVSSEPAPLFNYNYGDTLYLCSQIDDELDGEVGTMGIDSFSINVWRKSIDEHFCWRGEQDQDKQLCRVYFIRNADQSGYKNQYSFNAYYAPVAYSGFNPNFNSLIRDWSLYKTAYLYAPANSSTSYYLSSNGTSDSRSLYSPTPGSDDCVEIIARPTDINSYGYADRSESISIIQPSPGAAFILRPKSQFGSRQAKHSIGPHEVYLSITNRHSEQSVELKLNGTINVQLHLILGGYFQIVGSDNPQFYKKVLVTPFIMASGEEFYKGDFSQYVSDNPHLFKILCGISTNVLHDYQSGETYYGHNVPRAIQTCVYPCLIDPTSQIPTLDDNNGTMITLYYGCKFTCHNDPEPSDESLSRVLKAVTGFNPDLLSGPIVEIPLGNSSTSYIQLHSLADVCPDSHGWYNKYAEMN